jgi:hypothetical protein
MEILFRQENIGKMTNTYKEDYWVHGNFVPYNMYFKYKDFFDAVVCEDGMDETQFDKELLDESNWFIMGEDGLKGIWIPAIYDDGDVSIRYR